LTAAIAALLAIACLGAPWANFAADAKQGGTATAPGSPPLARCSRPPNPLPPAGPRTTCPRQTDPTPTPTRACPTGPSPTGTQRGRRPRTLRTAREKLTAPGVRSIKSRIIERVSIGGRRFRLEGSYIQGSDLRLKLELKVLPEAAEQGVEGSFLEVCDGNDLVGPVPDRHPNAGHAPRRPPNSQCLQNGGRANLLAVELGLGGLPALLASLERSMKFDALSQEEVNGKKFTVIAGAWTDAVREEFKASIGGLKTSHIPDAVRIYLEPEILFPRRIDFLKKHKSPDETRGPRRARFPRHRHQRAARRSPIRIRPPQRHPHHRRDQRLPAAAQRALSEIVVERSAGIRIIAGVHCGCL